jgi:hypothetical protein
MFAELLPLFAEVATVALVALAGVAVRYLGRYVGAQAAAEAGRALEAAIPRAVAYAVSKARGGPVSPVVAAEYLELTRPGDLKALDVDGGQLRERMKVEVAKLGK